MNTLWQDVRYGVRMLWKSPSATVVAVLALALGIGANSAIFSGVSAFILRPLPVEDHNQLARIFEIHGGSNSLGKFSYPDYVEYQSQNQVFDGLAGHRLVQAALSTGDRNDIIWGELVTGNYFDVLRVRPALGRTFIPEEDKTPGSHPVVVLSYKLWERRFARAAGLIGKSITLNGQSFTVIGIAPKGFMGTKFAFALDYWVPMMMQAQITQSESWLNNRGSHWFDVIGRLKTGVSREQASEVMTAIAQRLGQAYPDQREANTKVIVVPETEGRFDELASTVSLSSGLAMGVVSLILLIACANVANLLLAKATARRKEIGIRLALGASRARIIRQLLTESLLLALLGGGLGLLLAFWATDLMQAFIPVLPYTIALDFTPDAQALGFTLIVSLLTGIIFGLAPAWQASKPDLVPVLKGEASVLRQSSRRFTLRNLLVVAQIALSLVVLVCGGLLVKSFLNAQAIDPGFQTENGLVMSLNPGLLGYSENEGKTFYRQLVGRVENLPGVESASVARLLPLGDSASWTGPVVAEGQERPRPGEGLDVLYNVIGPKFFETLSIPILEGRDFNERDRDDAPPVVIINDTLAERLFSSGQNAIGRRLRIGSGDTPYREVIGVVKTGRYRSLGESPRPYLYLPQLQRYESGMTLIVRTTGDPKTIVDSVRREVQALDSRLPVYGVKTLKAHLSWALWGTRMAATLSLAFGLLALLLAVTGIYSLMAYTVSQRTREIGIRIALGARTRDVLNLVVGQGMKLIIVGVSLGLLGALALTRVMRSLLYEVSATDPMIFIMVAAALMIIALLACYLPARRATKVDPMEALRYE